MLHSARWYKILGFLIALTLLTVASGRAEFAGLIAEADALLQQPNLDFPRAQKALIICEGLFTTPRYGQLLLLPRLGRVCFILGDMASKNQRRIYYEKGLHYAEIMARDYPSKAEGHYWLALNLCGLADVEGYLQARRLLPRIFEQLTLAVAIDETYDQAGAHRVLGRIYYQAPAWPMSVGDPEKSLFHLNAAVRLAPENTTNHLYLAETLLRLHHDALARDQLEAVLKATQHAPNPRGVEEDRKEARRLLAEYVKDHAAIPDFSGTVRPPRGARGTGAVQESAPLIPSLPGPF